MADFSKVRSKRLGEPPPLEEASNNLQAPEVAPEPPAPPATPEPPAPARRDGRTARRTQRTLPFATRVSPAFDDRLRDIAERDGLLLVELLERALEAYENLHAK